MFNAKKKNNELLRTKISTLIGENTSVEGMINFIGGLHVIGTINGGAVSEDKDSILIVSESALVTGEVRVNHLIVNGQIDGDIYVDGKVELFDKARINGDIYYKILELPIGAQINGKLIRIEDNADKDDENV